MNSKIQIEQRIHPIVQDFLKYGFVDMKSPVGEFQYLYTTPKGKISLVRLEGEFYDDRPWEIYSLTGNLFDDCERFKTKEEAEEAIERYLI